MLLTKMINFINYIFGTPFLVRFMIATTVSFLSYHIVFSGINNYDQLFKWIQDIESYKKNMGMKFYSYYYCYKISFVILVGILSAALLALQYPDESIVANIYAIFYGMLGPNTIKDTFSKMIRTKSMGTSLRSISDLRNNVERDAQQFLSGQI